MQNQTNKKKSFYHHIFTSESVSEGHPDKVADQISDAILDACLEQDPESKVACETFCTASKIIIGGEISTKAKVNYDAVARNVIKRIGYTKETGLDPEIEIEILIVEQSKEINQAVVYENNKKNQGAGDQGIMFGYATNETESYMPITLVMAHELVRLASKLRKEGSFPWARPDMKSQVSYDYANNRVDTVLLSIQHNPFKNDKDKKTFMDFVATKIMYPTAKKFNKNLDFKILINPSGSFIKGGPSADTGLTGRKIIVDTYGGMGRHGGGGFSGKDGSKLDRSAAYGARYIAKNIVAHKLADRCEIQLSYAIGVAEPISIDVFTFGTGKKSDEEILQYIKNEYDLTPYGFIEHLGLNKPIFSKTAVYGHFGNDEYPWEKIYKSPN